MVMVLAVTAAAFVVLRGLNSGAGHQRAQQRITQQALTAAKRALIGYAVAYADGTHALDKGPGHLPCPDLAGGNPQGVAEGECRATSAHETGVLPYRTLGLGEARDGSGAALWYAVSDNYRSAAASPLNSDTPGTLFVDAASDVVAVIIAPGAPVAGQVRTAGNLYDAAAYLEDQNATAGDNHFVTSASGAFNDTVMVITRAELMRSVEQLVLHEAANALRNYYVDPDADDDAAGHDPDCATDPVCDDGFPWLAPLADAVSGSYAGEVGVLGVGRLPLVQLGVPFDADFTATWRILSAGFYIPHGSANVAPSRACLTVNACSELLDDGSGPGALVSFSGPIRGTPGAGWSQGRCTLTRANSAPRELKIDCAAVYDFLAGAASLRRVYRFVSPINTRIAAGTQTARRSVGVQQHANWPGGAVASVTMTDYNMPAATVRGSADLRFNSLGAGDSFDLLGVPFDLEVSDALTIDRAHSPGMLPNWFVANNWQQLLLVRFARSASPGYSNRDCHSDGSCLTVNLRRAGEATTKSTGGVSGVVVAAGARLATQARPSATGSSYLEGANATPGTVVFEQHDSSSIFNDQVRILKPP